MGPLKQHGGEQQGMQKEEGGEERHTKYRLWSRNRPGCMCSVPLLLLALPCRSASATGRGGAWPGAATSPMTMSRCGGQG